MNINKKAAIKAVSDMAMIFGSVIAIYLFIGFIALYPSFGIPFILLSVFGVMFWLFYDLNKHNIEMSEKDKLDEFIQKKKDEMR